jgi:hypothetical protein
VARVVAAYREGARHVVLLEQGPGHQAVHRVEVAGRRDHRAAAADLLAVAEAHPGHPVAGGVSAERLDVRANQHLAARALSKKRKRKRKRKKKRKKREG